MAQAAPRNADGLLFLTFDYDVEPAVGDYVKIVADRKVAVVTQAGDPCEVGRVINVRNSLKECTVATRHNWSKQDRIAGEAVTVGRFVDGPGNKVYQYTSASPASFVGSTVGPKTVTVSTDDAIKLTLENGADQTITITAGTNLTFAAIAAEINLTLVGMKAFVDAAGHLGVVANEIGKAITVGAVTHDAYTLLGWTAGIKAPTNSSHDPNACRGLIIVGGAKDAAVETLED